MDAAAAELPERLAGRYESATAPSRRQDARIGVTGGADCDFDPPPSDKPPNGVVIAFHAPDSTGCAWPLPGRPARPSPTSPQAAWSSVTLFDRGTGGVPDAGELVDPVGVPAFAGVAGEFQVHAGRGGGVVEGVELDDDAAV